MTKPSIGQADAEIQKQLAAAPQALSQEQQQDELAALNLATIAVLAKTLG